MIRTILLLLLVSSFSLLATAQTRRPVPQAEPSADAFALEPDYDTLQLFYEGPRVFQPCNPWPVEPYKPRPFNLRGKIFDSAANEVGSYFARGVVRQSDGAHVADYALTLKGIGTIIFAIDALPEVGPYAFDGFIASGPRRNEAYQLTLTPKLTTDCVWGMRWEFLLSIQQEGFKRQ